MSRTETKRTTIIILAIWILIAGFAAAAFAQKLSNPSACAAPATAFDLSTLPSLDSIGAQTNITAFMQNGVPAELQLAALRRGWSMDPAIRDYKGLQENDWDFEFDADNDILGFGDLDPDFDVQSMMARTAQRTPTLGGSSTETPRLRLQLDFLLLASWLQRPAQGAAP